MFEKYRKRHFAWELLILSRKMFIAGTTLFLSTRFRLRLPAEILCNFLYLLCLVRYLPYLTDHEVDVRRESMDDYEDEDRYACTSCMACCKGIASLKQIRSMKELNRGLDRFGINNMLDSLLTASEIFLGVSGLGTLLLADEIETSGLNRNVAQGRPNNSTLANVTSVSTEYFKIDSVAMAKHFPMPHAIVGIFEWLGGVCLMVGLLYFLFLLWGFVKEMGAEKCGKACHMKGRGKGKKGGDGVEMARASGSWKQQASTNPLFQAKTISKKEDQTRMKNECNNPQSTHLSVIVTEEVTPAAKEKPAEEAAPAAKEKTAEEAAPAAEES